MGLAVERVLRGGGAFFCSLFCYGVIARFFWVVSHLSAASGWIVRFFKSIVHLLVSRVGVLMGIVAMFLAYLRFGPPPNRILLYGGAVREVFN